MSGLFLAGLASGLAGGYQAGQNIADVAEARALRREELKQQRDQAAQLMNLRQREFEAGRLDQAERMGLMRDTLGFQRDSASADDARADRELEQRDRAERERLGLARDTLGFQQGNAAADNTRADRQVGVQEAESRRQDEELRLRREAAGRQREADTLKLAAARREEERAKRLERMPQVQEAIARWNLPGAPKRPEDLDLFRDVLRVDPAAWGSSERLGRMRQTFEGVLTGKVDPNSPEALAVGNELYGGYLRRGIGETHTAPDGRAFKVEDKAFAGLYQVPGQVDKFGVNVRVRGVDPAGKPVEYLAPATLYGTSDPNDQAILLDQHTFEGPAAAALWFGNRYETDPAVRQLIDGRLSQEMGTGRAKEAAEIETTKARGREADAKARKADAEAKAGPKGLAAADPQKVYEAKMDNIRSSIKTVVSGLPIGERGDQMALDLEERAGDILRAEPSLQADQVVARARRELGLGGAAVEPRASGPADAGRSGLKSPPTAAARPAESVKRAAGYSGPRPWLNSGP